MTGHLIKISDIPDEMYGGALPIAKNRKSLKRKMTEAEYLDDTPEFAAKVAKTSAPQTNPTTSDMLILQQEAQEADDSEHVDLENVIEINSGTSSSYISSNSSELDESTLNFICQITKTRQKATQSVPNKTDSVNQQPPQTTHQTSPEQTSTPNYLIPLQMILPEPVVETVVPESVQVTESEPSVTITVSEPIQKPTQTLPTTITQDQPSSSSIQTIKQTPPNLLESEFLEAEMLEISTDLQKLV